jgi:ATP-dependent DNA helicase UvrD/PcrA
MSINFLEDLNSVQRDAVSAIDGPVMIIAGAGSGKTRVLTYRIANLIRHNVEPHAILALTFTNKAAREMKLRIERLIGAAAANVWAGTFHSIFARILRFECEAIGFTRSFTIYDSDDSLSAVKNIMSSFNISMQQYNPRALQSRISGAKNQMITPEQYRESARDPLEQITERVFREYQQRLFASNAMDFDDLLLKPIELFQRNERILEKYQYRFRYILVDEYQDTNRSQYVLIKTLSRMFRNICVVGDDAQSIYAFRGADIRNILDFESDYPDCKVFRLEQNYRSTGTILAAADSVMKNNKHQIQKKLWTSNEHGDAITMIDAEDDKDEGINIATRVQQQCARLKLDLKDFAVLYRTNAQSRSLEDALRRASIPYMIVGGVEFYKRKENKDVLAYLRIIVNPKDEESLRRVINVPPRGIGETTIDKIVVHRNNAADGTASLLDVLMDVGNIQSLSERTKNAVAHFVGLLTKYMELKNQMSPSEIARALVDELGILKTYKEEATPDSISRWENVQELLSAITEYTAETPDPSLENFLEEVALVSADDKKEEHRNAVTLMTLHAAKGLEFPVVFITGLEEGLFPLYQSTLEPLELEEERRLFYVGITRAMKKLYLTHARVRFRMGELTYPVVSRFAEEVDDSLLMHESSRRSPALMSEVERGRNYSQPLSAYAQTRKASRENERRLISSDDVPDYENESQEQRTLHVGALVEHSEFGRGKVIQLAGQGENAKAVVAFESVGPKNLMLKFANLRIV